MAGIEAGFINVLIAPKLVSDFAGKLGLDINKAAGNAGEQAGKTLADKLSDGFNKAGKSLTKNVTAPLLAVGALGLKAGLELDGAFDKVRTTTGATGTELEKLQQNIRNVGSNTAASFENVADVISTLNTRLGLTGKPLEELSLQLLNLQQISGETTDIETVTQLFNAFGISGEKQAETLDKLFIITQKTGMGFNELISRVQGSVAQFQQLGFSAVDAAAFVAQLEKAGANSGAVLAGLNRTIIASVSGNKDAEKAYDDLAKAQEVLREKNLDLQVAELKLDEIRANPKAKPSDVLAAQNAVQKLKDEILNASTQIDQSNKIIADATGGVATSAKDLFSSVTSEITNLINAGNEAAANALAKDIFGARNFAQIVKQIKDGTFNIQEFTQEVLASSESINKVKEDTSDFDVTLKELKNSATVALEPIGNILIPALNSAFLAAKPIIEDFSNAFRNLSPETQKLILIFGGVAAAIGPALLILAKVVTAVQSIIAVVRLLNLTLLFNPWVLAATAAIAAIYLIIQNWDSIVAYFKNIFETLKTIFSTSIDIYKQYWQELKDAIVKRIDEAKESISKTIERIKERFSNLVNGLRNIGSRILEVIIFPFTKGGELITTTFTGLYNFFKTFITNIISLFKNLGTILGNAFINISKLPGLAQITSLLSGVGKLTGLFGGARANGGSVSADKAYLVGERGPEIVVPNKNGFVLPNNVLSGIMGNGGSANYTVNIYNPKAESSSASIPAALRRANILRSNV